MDSNARKATVALRLFLALLAIAILVALVLLWSSAVNERHRRVAALPGGLTVEYLGTAYGNTSFNTETKWQHLARKALPSALTGWIPAPSRPSIRNGSNALAVYVELKGPPGIGSTGMPWKTFRAVDDAGEAYQNSGAMLTSSDPAKGTVLCGMSINSYPRRQSEFWFEVGGSQGSTMARFRVQNPVTGPFPAWKTSPLPQTETNGPVELTLKNLMPPRPPKVRGMTPRFSLTTTNPAWTNAQPVFEEFIDATGNESHEWLPSSEPAWNVRACVKRRNLGELPGDEVLVLPALSIPGPGLSVPLDVHTNFLWIALSVTELSGGGPVGPTNGVADKTDLPPQNAHPVLKMKAQGFKDYEELEISVIDQDGKTVSSKMSGDNHEMRFVMSPYPTSKTLTVRLAISRPLMFEFIVNPADVFSTNYGK